MSRKHYETLATVMGDGLAIAFLAGGESAREEFYNECYTPLVLALEADNPRFEMTRFSFATATAEHAYVDAARECGREVSA